MASKAAYPNDLPLGTTAAGYSHATLEANHSSSTSGTLPSIASRLQAEVAAIRERYARRKDGFPHQVRSILSPERVLRFQERERAILAFLRNRAPKPLWQLRVLEVGCGYGSNLLQLIRWGCDPAYLVANELLEERLAVARELLPEAVRILPGDAASLDLPPEAFDLIIQSTVFSSILDPSFRQILASKMWYWLAPGGAVLWYDLRYPNPRNPDVCALSLAEIRTLFPEGTVYHRSITLLPPLARAAAQVGTWCYLLLAAFPPLRSHWLCWIEKPYGNHLREQTGKDR